MNASTISEKHRTVIPKNVAEAAGLKTNDLVEWRFEDGEIRGRKLISKSKEAFPRGSLLKQITPKYNAEQLAILSGCVQGPAESE